MVIFDRFVVRAAIDGHKVNRIMEADVIGKYVTFSEIRSFDKLFA